MKALTLRISVLEHCQLRCGYCLPGTTSVLAKNRWLGLSDYEKIARAFSRFAIRKVRFTGGEPLLRPELPQIISMFKRAMPDTPLMLTSNGQRLLNMGQALKDAGLHTITLHIDTLKEDRYKKLMGNGDLATAINAIDEAQKLFYKPKVNVVVQRDLNDDELLDFLLFSLKKNIHVRFIELMDTGSATDFTKRHFISGQQILEKLAPLGIKPVPREHAGDAARLYFAEAIGISFGLIASDTMPFCQHCDRVRLSADGKVFTCLYEPHGQPLDLNQDEEMIFRQIEDKLKTKVSFHPSQQKSRRIFSMSQTGG